MAASAPPETRFAQSGDVSIAYQVMGDGPIDLVLVPGIVSNLDVLHDREDSADFFKRLGRFARVATFDKRGQGLSDRIAGAPSLEQRSDDVRAVMDAIGMTRVVLSGHSEGSAMAACFAAMHPNRVSHVIAGIVLDHFGARDVVELRVEFHKRLEVYPDCTIAARSGPRRRGSADR